MLIIWYLPCFHSGGGNLPLFRENWIILITINLFVEHKQPPTNIIQVNH